MNQSQITIATSTVREHVKELDESDSSPYSISKVSSNIGVTNDTLKAFRDGRDDALPLSTIATWAKALDPVSFLMGIVEAPHDPHYDSDTVTWDRMKRMDQYDTMDAVRPEYSSARTCWADMVVTGAVGQADRYAGGFEPQTVEDDKKVRALLTDISYQINHRVLPHHEKHNLVRDMAHYGNAWEQIVIEEGDNGKLDLTRTMPLPTRRTRYVGDPTSERAYVVLPNEYADEADGVFFPSWKVVDFANRMSRQEKYGRGIGHSCIRSFVQTEAVEESSIIRRLERASQRYGFGVPVGNATGASEQAAIIKQWADIHRKQRTVDTSGDLRRQRIARTPDQDIYFPVTGRTGGEASVTVLQGDSNLDQVADINMFFNKWLCGLGPSKLMLGYEGDTTRSVGSETTIVFARKCRQMQMRFIHGINHMIWICSILRGVDPRQLKYVIFPPSLGTRDELIRAQVQQAYSSSIKQLADAFSNTGEVPSIRWFLRYFMQLDDDAIESLDLKKVVQIAPKGNAKANTNRGPDLSRKDSVVGPELTPSEHAKMVNQAARNPSVYAELSGLHFLLEERKLAKMKPAEAYSKGLYTNESFAPQFNVDRFRRMVS